MKIIKKQTRLRAMQQEGIRQAISMDNKIPGRIPIPLKVNHAR